MLRYGFCNASFYAGENIVLCKGKHRFSIDKTSFLLVR